MTVLIEQFANSFATYLTAAITSTTATSILVASAAPASLQGGQFRIRIDSEYMIVTGGQNGTTWTVVRGAENSTEATHLIDAPVSHYVTGGGLNNISAYLQTTLPETPGAAATLATFGRNSTWAQPTLRDFASVLDFGAIGDGVTDNSSAIIEAIASGADLWWPQGIYCVSEELVPGITSVRWRGTGAGNPPGESGPGSVIVWTPSGSGTLLNAAESAFVAEQIAFVYSNSGYTGNLVQIGNASTDAGQCAFRDCAFGAIDSGNPLGAASLLNLYSTPGTEVACCAFSGGKVAINGPTPGGTNSWANGVTIRDCNFSGYENWAIYNPAGAWKISRNIFEPSSSSGSTGIGSGSGSFIAGLHVDGNWFGDATLGNGAWIDLNSPTGVTIIGNHFEMYNPEGRGIALPAGAGISIISNFFDGTSGAGTNTMGIDLSGAGVSALAILGNMIDNVDTPINDVTGAQGNSIIAGNYSSVRTLDTYLSGSLYLSDVNGVTGDGPALWGTTGLEPPNTFGNNGDITFSADYTANAWAYVKNASGVWVPGAFVPYSTIGMCNSAQAMNTGSGSGIALVPINSVPAGDTAAWNLGSSEWICPMSGVYHISGTVEVTAGGAIVFVSLLFINGEGEGPDGVFRNGSGSSQMGASGGGVISSNISADAALEAGDAVQLCVSQGPSVETVTVAQACFMSIHRVA